MTSLLLRNSFLFIFSMVSIQMASNLSKTELNIYEYYKHVVSTFFYNSLFIIDLCVCVVCFVFCVLCIHMWEVNKAIVHKTSIIKTKHYICCCWLFQSQLSCCSFSFIISCLSYTVLYSFQPGLLSLRFYSKSKN